MRSPFFGSTVKIDFVHASGIFPSLHIWLHILCISLCSSSPPAIIISPFIPSSPGLFPFFSFLIACCISSYKISSSVSSVAGGLIFSSSMCVLSSLFWSVYSSLQYCVHLCLHLSLSIIIFPSLSFIAVCFGCHFLFISFTILYAALVFSSIV